MQNRVDKRRNVSGEMIPLTETTTRAKECALQSECSAQENVMRNASTEGPKLKKSRQGLLATSGFSSKKRKLGSEDSLEVQKSKKGRQCRLLKRKGKPCNGYRMQVLLSTPGKSRDLSSGQVKRTVRSVLSWMIENGMVAQNQRVFYWNRKENCSQAEGWITCEGILCACCKKVYTLTNFEAHAGSKNHRPSANLILEDGRSLLQCQMQVLDNNNRSKERRTSSRERRKGRTHLFESDDICNICHVSGTLILCDHCPSSFHLECIQMEVKVKNWIDGVEGTSMVGLSARFGSTVPSKEDEAHLMTLVNANPLNCCENSSTQIIYGTVLKLMHDRTKFCLHSHEVPYGSGSGQQLVTGFPNVDDSNSYWIVRPIPDSYDKQGDVITSGTLIRLQHMKTCK